jgi:regulator of cell morphogenesis and NO signaling
MTITPETTVAEIATVTPATIRVFQQHHIDYCCGGKVPLTHACAAAGLDLDAVLGELRAAVAPAAPEPSWAEASLKSLVEHIQSRYHAPLRIELPRLDAMLDKVVSRHGDRLPDVLLPLQQTFKRLQQELLEHMSNEDRILFPLIVALEAGEARPATDAAAWLQPPIAVMEADHESAGAALAFIRQTTAGFAPPDWACPTFRGLYYGLAQLETDMHLHVHLENNILFPRAARLAEGRRPRTDEIRERPAHMLR